MYGLDTVQCCVSNEFLHELIKDRSVCSTVSTWRSWMLCVLITERRVTQTQRSRDMLLENIDSLVLVLEEGGHGWDGYICRFMWVLNAAKPLNLS